MQSDVKVVYCVSGEVAEAVIGSTTEEFEAVALALTEIPFDGYVEMEPVPDGTLEFELSDEVIGAEWVWSTVVEFSVQSDVNVV